MSSRRKHLYHIVNPSSRAFFISIGAFFFMSGFGFYLMNKEPVFFKGDLCIIAIIFLALNIKRWYNEVITESTFSGFHTKIVQSGLKLGFLLFLVSEFMLFFGFFWAYFHLSLSPDFHIGVIWPPKGIVVVNSLEIPLLNTLILLLSGCSLTWSHQALVNNLVSEVLDGLIITILLGILFLCLQGMEYYESTFSYNDSAYSSIFYMLTGLHCFHVIVGVIFLTNCLYRYVNKQFTTTHHLGFLFAIWYWHFVDVVWLLLFLIVYVWGGGIGSDVDNTIIISSLFN